MVLAYMRMNSPEDALASVEQMVARFATVWRMDNPLVDFGLEPYQPDELINLTVDNFGNLAAFIRGLFEYLYTAVTLTLIPHVPDTLTTLEQNFGIRWGAYRLFLRTEGVRSSGVAAVTVNGISLPATSFNATAVVLTYSSLPACSPAAALAVNSTVSTASTRLNITLTFKNVTGDDIHRRALHRRPTSITQHGAQMSVPVPPPALNVSASLWLKADDLHLHDGEVISEWPSAVAGLPAAKLPVEEGAVAPTFVADGLGSGKPSVRFNGVNTSLIGQVILGPAKTLFAVFKDTGSTDPCCNDIIAVWRDTMDINGIATQRTPNNTTVMLVDWAGSASAGDTDVGGHAVQTSLVYGLQASTMNLNGCFEAQAGTTDVATTNFSIGSRRGERGRFFKGEVAEVVAFSVALTEEQVGLMEEYLHAKWLGFPGPTKCTSSFNCSAIFTVAPSTLKTLAAFDIALRQNATLSQTLVASWTSLLLDYAAAFEARCDGLNNGTLVWPDSRPSLAAKATLTAYAQTFQQLERGLQKRVAECTVSSDLVCKGLVAAWTASGNPLPP